MKRILLLITITTSSIFCLEAQPNLIDNYLSGGNSFTEVANKFDQVRSPTDLDFHTDPAKMELWIVNKETENSGGSTLTISNLGESNQNKLWRKDGNAWHFMSLPTGIAFGKDGFFATSPGVYDANHNGGQPFTGPTLWSSDPNIYAKPSGGNGSHMDMLHESPRCQGITHEKDNVYWVFDGYNGDIVRYDFKADHGAGNDYHGDGVIHRYSEETLQKDPDNKVVSHLHLDKPTGWLYAVDHGNQRVIRLDINTGQTGGTPSFGPYEQLAEYRNITGYTWEEVVTSGLQEPAGIAVLDDRMLVSDYATGEIIVYDISSMPADELGRISTSALGIMGITIGPEGMLYYVDHDNSSVHQITPAITGIQDQKQPSVTISPNPSSDGILKIDGVSRAQVNITDISGRLVFSGNVSDNFINTSIEQAGVYLIEVVAPNESISKHKWIIN